MSFYYQPVLKVDLVELRPLRSEDYDDLYAIAADPLGEYRVFYEITAARLVRVLAVGYKLHNDLFIRGRRFEI